MKEQSYYSKNSKRLLYPTLKNDLHCDVVIVGGGLTGILSAYYLKDSGLNVVVLESDTYLNKTSGRSTGKVTVLQGLMYQELVKHYGLETAKRYYHSNLEALEEVKNIIDKERIRCDSYVVDHYVYTNEKENTEKVINEFEILKEIGADVSLEKIDSISSLKSIRIQKQLLINPMDYGQALIEICKESGVIFYDHSKVTEIKEVNLHNQIYCNNYIVSSSYAIVATRYPIPVGIHNYLLQLQQSISYLCFVESDFKLDDSYYCIDDHVTSYRKTKYGYLYGGYGHDVGNCNITYEDIVKGCKEKFKNEPSLFWSSQDCMSNRLLPYIGYYHNEHCPIYVACGYNKWGMTMSHIAGKLIRDLIILKDSQYKELYSPLRNRYKIILSKGIKMSSNLWRGYIVKRISYNAVQNEANKQTLNKSIKPICSHAKGILCYNTISKTWDCINHGARFDLSGKVLEMPALVDLEYKE